MADMTVPELNPLSIPPAPLGILGVFIELTSYFIGELVSPFLYPCNPVISPPIEDIELLKSDFPGSNLGRLFILFLYLNSMIIYI